MNCKTFGVAIHEYYRGTLAAPEREDVELHRHECAPCAELDRRCGELTCCEFVEFLNEYIDHELSPERERIFERHLELCADCNRYLENYRKAMEASVFALLAGPSPVPGEIPEELVRAILAARSS